MAAEEAETWQGAENFLSSFFSCYICPITFVFPDAAQVEAREVLLLEESFYLLLLLLGIFLH